MLLANSENLTPQPPSLEGKGESGSPSPLWGGVIPFANLTNDIFINRQVLLPKWDAPSNRPTSPCLFSSDEQDMIDDGDNLEVNNVT